MRTMQQHNQPPIHRSRTKQQGGGSTCWEASIVNKPHVIGQRAHLIMHSGSMILGRGTDYPSTSNPVGGRRLA